MKTKTMEWLIPIFKATFATLMVVVCPTWPVIGILLVAHLIDVVSAMMLNSRLRKCNPEKYEKVKLSSDGFKKMIKDFGFEMLVIFLVMLVEINICPGIPVTKWVVYLMIGSQLISILENTSECNGQRWAVYANRIFKSKASRYLSEKLGIDDNDIFKE